MCMSVVLQLGQQCMCMYLAPACQVVLCCSAGWGLTAINAARHSRRAGSLGYADVCVATCGMHACMLRSQQCTGAKCVQPVRESGRASAHVVVGLNHVFVYPGMHALLCVYMGGCQAVLVCWG